MLPIKKGKASPYPSAGSLIKPLYLQVGAAGSVHDDRSEISSPEAPQAVQQQQIIKN